MEYRDLSESQVSLDTIFVFLCLFCLSFVQKKGKMLALPVYSNDNDAHNDNGFL